MIRNPIHIITNADLEQNGGRWKLQGGAVIPVEHLTLALASAAGDKLVAGSITPVYFVTAAQLATPRFKLMGGDDKRVYDGIVARGIRGGAAIPVYDPNYSAANPWYDPNGEGLCLWAAYQAVAVGSFAASLLDISGNGNDAGDPGGLATPAWNSVNGWVFAIDDYLTTTFVPTNDQSQSVFVQFTDVTTPNDYLFGSTDLVNASLRIAPQTAGDCQYWHGNVTLIAPPLLAGNLGISGDQGYRNGVADGAAIGAYGNIPAQAVYIGALNNPPSGFISAYIRAVAIYDCTLAAPQVLAVATAMAAL